MTWDDSKSTFQTRPDVAADEKLTSGEWNNHVDDQKDHSGRHENGGVDEITVEGLGGDLADPQDPKQEAVEDFVDGLLTAGASVDLTYDDGAGTLTIAITEGTIDHDALTNYVANEHIDHSGVNITAGAGLTGGGDITTSQTLNAHAVTTETSAYTASENDIVLADASGGAFTVTLPSPSADLRVSVKKVETTSNAVTIATPGSKTIDGDSSRTVTAQYVSREIISDGTNYYII